MSIETLDDIIEELANQLGIYGGCPDTDSIGREHCKVCTCRSGWTAQTRRRIERAVWVEEALEAAREEEAEGSDPTPLLEG